MVDEQKTLTLREAAQEVGCSKETVRRAVAAGDLSAASTWGAHGRELRVTEKGLRHWWQAHTGGGSIPVVEAPQPQVPQGVEAVEAVEEAEVVTRSEAPSAVPTGWAEIHARALEVAAQTLAQNQELMNQRQAVEQQLAEERERAARAERQAEELRFSLTQHQRALSEVAESLAEERARAQAAEMAAEQTAAAEPELPAPPPAPSRRGWGTRLRGWLRGKQAS